MESSPAVQFRPRRPRPQVVTLTEAAAERVREIMAKADKPYLQGRFSIIAPLGPDDTVGAQPFRFGVTDESGKINLNALLQIDSSGQTAYNMLMALPNMTAFLSASYPVRMLR